MSKSNVLEVDEYALWRNLLPKSEEQKEFEELLKLSTPSDCPSVKVRPLPGICIKTRTEDGKKVFINLCQTSEIPEPKDISEDMLFQEKNLEVSDYVIPMSIGQERLETDKDGKNCSTYDVAINSNYFQKCQKKKMFLVFTITAVIEAISQKYNKTLNENYIILKNRKVMGNIQDHRIEKREVRKPEVKRPLIEELPSDNKKSEKNNEDLASLSYVILRTPKEGKAEQLIGRFKIHNSVSPEDITVYVGEDRIIVNAEKVGYSVDIFVPHSIISEQVVALMDKNIGILQLNMPTRC